MRYKEISNLIVDPELNKALEYNDHYFFNKEKKFYLVDEILDMFSNDPETDEITQKQKIFYEDVKFPNYDDLEDFSMLIEKSEKSYFAKKLDEEIPNGSKVIEIGCGTGQMSNFLSRFNRTIVGVDLSIPSLKLAEKFRKNNDLNNVFFLKMNLFKPSFKTNTFDILISNGCLHHTINPRKAFSCVTKLVKSGGIVIIGLYHKNGRLFTNFRQIIFKIFKNRFKFLDPRNLNKNISASKRYAWYRDQYQNPKEFSYKFGQVLEWFKENNIEYLSSIPFHKFNGNFRLFEKNELPSNFYITLKEFLMTFDPNQIKEGGFFVMIGRKI